MINHRFHVDSDKGELGISCDMIIGRGLMVQIVLTDDFKRQVLKWDGTTLHIKEPRSLLGQSDLTKCNMHEVVIQNEEPASARESTEWMVNILDITYAKEDLKQVADNVTHINAEEITLLISLLKDLEEIFDGTLGNWSTEPVDL